MGFPSRIYYSESERQKIFDRWLAGESQNAIARSFGRSHSSIQGVLARTGGIRPRKRRRPRRALSLAEREEISRGIVAGRSTVSRELQRNGGRRRYRANRADKAAWDRAHRPKTCKLA